MTEKPAHHYSRDFPNIERVRLGVKALIVNQGKILVLKERIPYDGEKIVVHDLPGGGIEPGEDLETALKREVFEEVGLKITVGKLLGTWDFIVPKRTDPDTAVHIVCLGYQCSLNGSAQIDTSKNPAEEDIFATEWLTPEEITTEEGSLFTLENMSETVKKVKIS